MRTPFRPAAVIVLAAGEGTRMKSATPKVLHELCGRPMLGHVVEAARALEPRRLAVVVGHGREQVTGYLASVDPEIRPIVQEVQHGTGHAARVAMEGLAAQDGEFEGTVLVVFGDTPLLTADTMLQLTTAHIEADRAVTVLTADVPDPTGYGRILRRDGHVVGTVEQKDATPEQAAITEINSGVFAFDAKVLRDALGRLSRDNAQGEEYLTDVLGLAAADGLEVGAFRLADWRETLGCNDRLQLAQLRQLLNSRLTDHWMREGVTIVDPASTWLDVQVTLARDVLVHPNTQLRGATAVGEGAEVGPNCTITDTLIGERAKVSNTTAERAEVGAEVNVGPYCYLREGARLARGSKAGTFVEIKKSVIGEGSKVPHLSYVGDATIGVGCNLGAGTITANYDGVNKYHSEIGDHVFIGSDTTLIAPVHVHDGAFVAGGSAITMSVEPGALAVARGRQRNIAGYVERKRPGGKAAAAAAKAREQAAAAGDAQPADGGMG